MILKYATAVDLSKPLNVNGIEAYTAHLQDHLQAFTKYIECITTSEYLLS